MKLIRFLFFLICCIYFSNAGAQIKWPEITQTNKPWTRWWWEGSAVNKKDLTASMQRYQEAGLGGLEITPIYGVKGYEKQFINYLSVQWMEMLTHTLKEAKRLALGIDMATGTGWPFGGPWITPEEACRNINLKTWNLKAGETIKEPIRFLQEALVRTVSGKPVDIKTLSYPVATNKNLQAYAFDQVRYPMILPLSFMIAYSDKGGVVDLTPNVDSTGKLNWTAPDGNWDVYALFEGWHGKMVERAAPGGEGEVIDHFSEEALAAYLQYFDKAFTGNDITGIRAFFNDSYEVDDARGQANWTPNLFAEFQQRRGYDLRLHLPALFQKDSAATNSRVLYDYRQTISELLLENFTRPWHAWAKQKGKLIRNQSHGSPANILDLYAAIDIPETEGTDILRFKFATSAANVNGKPLASAESATWLNEHFISSLGDVKQAIDKYFLGGVNHIFYHGTNYSPQTEAWPGWLFYAAVHFTPANPFWKDFGTLNSYVARCQSFLQSGKPDNDVLLYFPINDRFSEPGRELLQHFDGMEGFENSVFQKSAAFMLDDGYTFDLVSDKQIQHIQSVNNLLQTGGVYYKTIILSGTKYLPLETLNQLVKLANEGATIIFHNGVPQDVPGFGKLTERRQDFRNLMAALSFVDNGSGIKIAVSGKGSFLNGDDLPGLLTYAKARRETMKSLGLQCIRRSYNNGHLYFICNPGKNMVKDWVTLETDEPNVIIFDPLSEVSGKAKTRKSSTGKTEVWSQLNAGESYILQTTHAKVEEKVFPYYASAGDAQPIAGTWNLHFLQGGPSLPSQTNIITLTSWTTLPGNATKIFSGTAQYSIRFKKPPNKADAWMLDLGDVQESAEVFLNKKRIRTLLGPSYQLVIPASHLSPDNLLEIKVTNSMANRIIDLEKRGVQWKKFYNTNFPARFPANRGSDGLFTAAKWEPRASGLLGPVTITPVALIK